MCASARVSTGRAVGTISLRVIGSYDSAPLRSSAKVTLRQALASEPYIAPITILIPAMLFHRVSIVFARFREPRSKVNLYYCSFIIASLVKEHGRIQRDRQSLPEEKSAGLFLGRLPKPLLALAILPANEPLDT